MSAPMALDQSLDTLIKANKKTRRPGRKAAPADKKKVSSTSKAKKAAITGKQKAAPAAVAPAAVAPIATSNKINISNLPLDVKEPEVKDLFAKTVGPVREAQLYFDSKGQSKGIGSVVFNRKEDALKAVTMYNGRLIDGSG